MFNNECYAVLLTTGCVYDKKSRFVHVTLMISWIINMKLFVEKKNFWKDYRHVLKYIINYLLLN